MVLRARNGKLQIRLAHPDNDPPSGVAIAAKARSAAGRRPALPASPFRRRTAAPTCLQFRTIDQSGRFCGVARARPLRSSPGVTHFQKRRVELDVGSGKGAFALAVAAENPRTLVLGVDINQHCYGYAERQRRLLAIDNVRFIHSEALEFITVYVPDRSVSSTHVYFPTPYIGEIRKTNVLAEHLDRWLFSDKFVTQVRRISRSGASLRLVTDHQAYFVHAHKVAAHHGLIEADWVNPLLLKSFGEVVGTGCEKEMRKLGKPIYSVQWSLG